MTNDLPCERIHLPDGVQVKDADCLDGMCGRTEKRWQDAIYTLLRKRAARPDEIDGSGCDSGDALDVTLSEISQGINQAEEKSEQAEAELLRLCGPPCPYDGKRASEHRYISRGGQTRVAHVELYVIFGHESWPDGVAWHEERAK